jgi:predicted RND superfamily exporter protein
LGFQHLSISASLSAMATLLARLNPHDAVVQFFSVLARTAIKRPLATIVGVLIVTLVVAPGVRWLRLRTDGHALISEAAPEVLYDKAIRAKFGIQDQIVILIHSSRSNGIFNPNTLQLVRDLTAECAKLPEVNPANLMSLATEPNFRMRPGTLIHETMLERPLKTQAELDQLRDDLNRIQLYTSTFVSSNGDSTVILIGTAPGADRTALYRKVSDIVAAKKGSREEIAVTGAPVAESLLGIHILEDLGVPGSLLGASTRGHEEKLKMPSTFYELRLLIAHRLGLVPVSILVMMLVFLLSFRNVPAMLLPLPGVGCTLLFVFGLMGWCGVPVYLTIAVMPVLLTATGVTNDIYVFSRYFTLLREQPATSHLAVVTETFEKMVRPITNTSLTTAIGFFSFGVSPLKPVQAFGIWTGIGVLFGLFYSFTVVPAILALINPKWLPGGKARTERGLQSAATSEYVQPANASPGCHQDRARLRTEVRAPTALGSCFARLCPLIIRRRGWVIFGLLLITALTPLGLLRLTVQDSWTDAFDPSSAFRRATKRVNEDFYGMHLLFISCDVPRTVHGEVPVSAVNPDGISLPANIADSPALIAGSTSVISASNAVWRSHIEMISVIGTNISARIPRRDTPTNFWAQFPKTGNAKYELVLQSQLRPEVIRATADLARFIRARPQYAVGGVLSPADYIETTRFMARPNDPGARIIPDDPGEIKLMWDYYGLALGRQRLHQIVDTNYWQSLTTVFLKDANFMGTDKLMKDIRAYGQEHLTGKGIKIGFAGDVALSQALIRGIVTTQLLSLCFSLAGIFLVTVVLGGSWRWGIYCVLPSLLAVLIKFAVMGWAGIPLGVATSMFAAMTLGIGVNCAIQLLEGYDLAHAGNASSAEALQRAFTLTGPAALINTVAVCLGFGVLMLSQVPANSRLGFLVVIGLAGCFVLSLLILPVLLHWKPIAPALCSHSPGATGLCSRA